MTRARGQVSLIRLEASRCSPTRVSSLALEGTEDRRWNGSSRATTAERIVTPSTASPRRAPSSARLRTYSARNRISEAIRSQIVDLALDQPELSPRELAVRFTDETEYFVSEASVYRLLKAHDLITSPAYIVIKAAEAFKDKTTAPNQLWQTDFTYLKITGWGWYYLSTVLDDFSRFIVAWKLCATMKALDVTATLDLALAASGLDQMTVVHRPRLLSDNGSSYVATDLAKWLDQQNMEHVRSAPYHPQTQGKIERWHQTLKNRILLEHYYLPGDLGRQVTAFVEHYNHDRYHESLDNLTPADVYFWHAETILLERERIKRQTIANRRLQHQLHAA